MLSQLERIKGTLIFDNASKQFHGKVNHFCELFCVFSHVNLSFVCTQAFESMFLIVNQSKLFICMSKNAPKGAVIECTANINRDVKLMMQLEMTNSFPNYLIHCVLSKQITSLSAARVWRTFKIIIAFPVRRTVSKSMKSKSPAILTHKSSDCSIVRCGFSAAVNVRYSIDIDWYERRHPLLWLITRPTLLNCLIATPAWLFVLPHVRSQSISIDLHPIVADKWWLHQNIHCSGNDCERCTQNKSQYFRNCDENNRIHLYRVTF